MSCCCDDCLITKANSFATLTKWEQIEGDWTVDDSQIQTTDTDALIVNKHELDEDEDEGLMARVLTVVFGEAAVEDKLRIIFDYLDDNNYLFIEIVCGDDEECTVCQVYKCVEGETSTVGEAHKILFDMTLEDGVEFTVYYRPDVVKPFVQLNDLFRVCVEPLEGLQFGVGTGDTIGTLRLVSFVWSRHHVDIAGCPEEPCVLSVDQVVSSECRWDVIYGEWEVDHSITDGMALWFKVLPEGTTHYTVAVGHSNIGVGTSIGLVFDYLDEENYHFVRRDAYGIKLYKVTGGVTGSAITLLTFGLMFSSSGTLTVQVDGNQLDLGPNVGRFQFSPFGGLRAGVITEIAEDSMFGIVFWNYMSGAPSIWNDNFYFGEGGIFCDDYYDTDDNDGCPVYSLCGRQTPYKLIIKILGGVDVGEFGDNPYQTWSTMNGTHTIDRSHPSFKPCGWYSPGPQVTFAVAFDPYEIFSYGGLDIYYDSIAGILHLDSAFIGISAELEVERCDLDGLAFVPMVITDQPAGQDYLIAVKAIPFG